MTIYPGRGYGDRLSTSGEHRASEYDKLQPDNQIWSGLQVADFSALTAEDADVI